MGRYINTNLAFRACANLNTRKVSKLLRERPKEDVGLDSLNSPSLEGSEKPEAAPWSCSQNRPVTYRQGLNP